jgi:hypothetical protein
MYPKCPGMPITYRRYLEASFAMDRKTAESITNSDLKKICYLYYLDNEGRGEASKYTARELGLEDIPSEENLKGMARAYITAVLAKIPEEMRRMTLKQLAEEYKLE